MGIVNAATIRALYITLRGDFTSRLAELTPASLAETLAQRLPDAKLVVVPGAGHAANLTHPQVVTPAIESFLASLRPV